MQKVTFYYFWKPCLLHNKMPFYPRKPEGRNVLWLHVQTSTDYRREYLATFAVFVHYK